MHAEADRKERLDLLLVRLCPEHSRSRLAKLIDGGGVMVNGTPARKAGHPLEPGDTVEIPEMPPAEPHDLTPWDTPLDVRYEDDSLLIINKARGVATHPAPGEGGQTLVNALLHRGQPLSPGDAGYRPGIVHRLDKATTGLIMVAKTEEAHRALTAQIQAKTAQRRYVALVKGLPESERFTIDAPIGRHPIIPTLMGVKKAGRQAITHLRRLAPFGFGALMAVKLETGRTHQIRVHCAHFGMPVKGDALYSTGPWREGPLQLHAAFLGLTHPLTGQPLDVYAKPPEDFEAADLTEEAAVRDWE